jgi:glycerophosphoryl diester phosphodiesterase
MAGWTLLSYILATLLLVPLLSGAVSALFFGQEFVVVGNEDLLTWILRPAGLGYVLLIGGLAIAAGVIRYAGLFRILVDDLDDRPVSVRQTLVELLPNIPALLKLCVATIIGALLLFLPLLGALFAVYFGLLGEFDINYYIAQTPQEWYVALAVAGALVVIWAIPAVHIALRTIPALPAYLDGHRPLRRAVRESWRRTRGEARRGLWLFGLTVAAWVVLRLTLHGLYALAAAPAWRFMDVAVDSLTPLLVATIVWAAGTLAIDIIVSFIGFSLAATVLTKFYFEDTDLHRIAPAIPLGLRAFPRRVGRAIVRWMRPTRLLPVVALVVLLSLGAAALLMRGVAADPHFIIIAHRAGAHIGVENTLETLERAIEAGSDWAEIDVQLSADGEIIVKHDADMMRLADSPLRIAETDAATLLSLELIAPPDAPPEERRLATLDEFLERSRGRIGLMIELKYYGFDPSLSPAVIERVRSHQMENEVMIISLSTRALEQTRQLAPELRLGFLSAVTVGDMTRLPVEMLGVAAPALRPSLIRSARRDGIEVHVWTLNTIATMLAAIDRGADGVITDQPFMAAALRRELATLSRPERLILRLRNLLPDIDYYLVGEAATNEPLATPQAH